MVQDSNHFLKVHELPKLICAYLNYSDALSFSQTCKSIHDVINFGTLQDVRIAESSGRWIGSVEGRDTPLFWQFLSFEKYVSSLNLHSIRIKFKWVDQGWGNRKSLFQVVRHTKNHNNRISQDDGQHWHVVYQTPEFADDEVNTLEVEANFDASYEYSLWVVVGGGCGHQLTIKDMKIYA